MRTSRITTAALTGLLALSLAACGSSSDDTDTSPGVSAPAGPTQEDEETSAEDDATDDAGATDDGADDTTSDDAAGTDDAGATDDEAAGTGGAEGGGSADEQLALLEALIALAEDEAGGTAYEIDDVDDDGSWEIDVAVDNRSVEVTVSREGQVIDTEDDDLDDDDRNALDAAQITMLDAATTALAEVDGVLDDIELDEEDGTFAWEVTIDTDDEDDVEVYVDVVSGEVIKVDRD